MRNRCLLKYLRKFIDSKKKKHFYFAALKKFWNLPPGNYKCMKVNVGIAFNRVCYVNKLLAES